MLRAYNGSETEDTDDKPPPTRGATTLPCELAELIAASEPTTREIQDQWHDWRWQMRRRIRSMPQLAKRFPGVALSQEMVDAAGRFPMSITPYYAALIEKLDASDPIFQMSVPQAAELFDPPFLVDDPLHEDKHMPVPGLVHRYRDRALVLATSTCSMYCRHCTRKRVAGQRESRMTPVQLTRVADYLSVHPEIHDVIISGGDPLTMSSEALEKVIQTVRAVPSVDVIRIGTRTPVVMPMRVTNELVTMLRRYHPLYINTHFNHPRELTPEAEAACRRLADAGIPLGNQTVLLRGVNDDAVLLADLFRKLLRTRVRPYYLFQCDLVRGVEHFRTPISKGIEIMEYLRGRLDGLAIPSYVIDAPEGGSKIPVLPNYVVSTSPTHTVLRNFEGRLVSYPEPSTAAAGGGQRAAAAVMQAGGGVWDLSTGRGSVI